MLRKKILVIEGPNTNLLGDRESSIYGKESFDSVNRQIEEKAEKIGLECEVYHSNVEGNIVSKIQKAREQFDAIVINAGSYSYYSYAIRDALSGAKIPAVEVHPSNIYAQEEFRRKSVLADICLGQICGFGKQGYFMALEALNQIL